MNASAHSLHLLDFWTVDWSSFPICRKVHWFNFIYKSICILASYLSDYMLHKHFSHSLQSQEFITFSVPSVCAELGKNTFSFSASSSLDTLQKYLQLSQLISLIDFEIKNEFPVPSESFILF